MVGTGASDGYRWNGSALASDLGAICPVGINGYGQVLVDQRRVTTLRPQTGPAGPPVIGDGSLVAGEVRSTGDTDIWRVPRSWNPVKPSHRE